MKTEIRRWLVPGLAAGSIVVPLFIGGCIDDEDAPFWYGMPGCEQCSSCYDEWAGFFGEPAPEGMPEEFLFTGDPPDEGTVGGGEAIGAGGTDETDDSDPEAGTGDTPRLRPTGIPDAVLRPKPDRPGMPKVPTGSETIRNYPTPSGGKSYGSKSPKQSH